MPLPQSADGSQVQDLMRQPKQDAVQVFLVLDNKIHQMPLARFKDYTEATGATASVMYCRHDVLIRWRRTPVITCLSAVADKLLPGST